MLTKIVTTILEENTPFKKHQTSNDILESTHWTEVINKKIKTRPSTAREKAPVVIVEIVNLFYTEAL
jgi:hypothetical protein